VVGVEAQILQRLKGSIKNGVSLIITPVPKRRAGAREMEEESEREISQY